MMTQKKPIGVKRRTTSNAKKQPTQGKNKDQKKNGTVTIINQEAPVTPSETSDSDTYSTVEPERKSQE